MFFFYYKYQEFLSVLFMNLIAQSVNILFCILNSIKTNVFDGDKGGYSEAVVDRFYSGNFYIYDKHPFFHGDFNIKGHRVNTSLKIGTTLSKIILDLRGKVRTNRLQLTSSMPNSQNVWIYNWLLYSKRNRVTPYPELLDVNKN